MPEAATVSPKAPNTAERDVRHNEQGFVFHEDAASMAPGTGAPILALHRQVFVHPLSDSNSVIWVQTTYADVNVRSAAPEPNPGGELFFSAPQAFIRQVKEDLDQLPESLRWSPAAKYCEQFAGGVGMALAFMPSVRCAVFGDEEDGVKLVAHSHASMRQVSLEFGLKGSLINIVRIDERMHRSVQTCGNDKVRTLAEAIAWLKPVNDTSVGPFSVDMQESEMLSPGMTRGDTPASQERHLGNCLVPTSAEQRIANLRAWIATHSPLPYEADDSRESIYEDREE